MNTNTDVSAIRNTLRLRKRGDDIEREVDEFAGYNLSPEQFNLQGRYDDLVEFIGYTESLLYRMKDNLNGGSSTLHLSELDNKDAYYDKELLAEEIKDLEESRNDSLIEKLMIDYIKIQFNMVDSPESSTTVEDKLKVKSKVKYKLNRMYEYAPGTNKRFYIRDQYFYVDFLTFVSYIHPHYLDLVKDRITNDYDEATFISDEDKEEWRKFGKVYNEISKLVVNSDKVQFNYTFDKLNK